MLEELEFLREFGVKTRDTKFGTYTVYMYHKLCTKKLYQGKGSLEDLYLAAINHECKKVTKSATS